MVANAQRLDAAIVHSRDNGFDYFGFKTLERSYLLRIEGLIVERPQVPLQLNGVISHIATSRSISSCESRLGSTRCCTHLHFQPLFSVIYLQGNMERVVETYDLMSEKYFTHASPTMFNAGKAHQAQSVFTVPTATFFDIKIMMVTWLSQELPAPSSPPVSSLRWRGTASRAILCSRPTPMSACSDIAVGIFSTLTTCAQISKTAGGIGMHCSNIRATGSYICGTNGHSNGLVPMLRCIKYDSRSCFQLSFLCSGFSTRPQDTSTKAAASVLVRPPAT